MSEIEKKHPREIGFPSCDINGFKWGSNERYVGSFKRADLEKKAPVDMVNHPPHYKDASGIECIEVTKHMSFCGGNCFKYLYRAGKKGSTVEDLKKAAWYAKRAWEQEEVVCVDLLEKIWTVSKHRKGNIALAIDFIAEDMWADVERFINKEIARLENE